KYEVEKQQQCEESRSDCDEIGTKGHSQTSSTSCGELGPNELFIGTERHSHAGSPKLWLAHPNELLPDKTMRAPLFRKSRCFSSSNRTADCPDVFMAGLPQAPFERISRPPSGQVIRQCRSVSLIGSLRHLGKT